MNFLILLLCLFQPVDDGTLVFVKGGNRIVKFQTDSEITHVGIIFIENSEPYLYEATPPRVRKIALKDYLKEIEETNKKHPKNQRELVYVNPSMPADKIASMKKYAESQIGRSYGVRSYVKGKELSTIHCSEYVSRILIAGGENIDVPYKQTPDSLMKKYLKMSLL